MHWSVLIFKAKVNDQGFFKAVICWLPVLNQSCHGKNSERNICCFIVIEVVLRLHTVVHLDDEQTEFYQNANCSTILFSFINNMASV